MKEKVCLLVTLILSLFLFSGKVEAAREMSCLYDGDALNSCRVLVQDSLGNIKLYVGETSSCKFDDPKLHIVDDYDLIFDDTSKYDKSTGELTECPPWTSPISRLGNLVGRFRVNFYDEEVTNAETEFKLIDANYDSSFDTSNQHVEFSSSEDYSEKIKNTEWTGHCTYGIQGVEKLDLYFNDETFIFVNRLNGRNTSKMRFSLNDLLEHVDLLDNACPTRIYEYYSYSATPGVASAGIGDYYLIKPTGVTGNVSGTIFEINEYVLVEEEGNFEDSNDSVFVPVNPDDCGALLGPELIKIINDVMNIVRIIVPILLLGLGILDFTKATFSGSADDMAKIKKTFIRRIIAAVIVFLIPIFVNLLLTLANEVWGYINPTSCIK